jgi:transcription initiation factor TFIIE subunit beta
LELIDNKSVLVTRNRDNTPKIVYYNDCTHSAVISNEFKAYWHQQQIPPDIDIEQELIKIGLKPVKVISKQKIVPANAQKKKRKTRFKMTNTHLQGVGNSFFDYRFNQRIHSRIKMNVWLD